MSVKVRLEFLDGTCCILDLPDWHRDTEHLVAAKPGTIEDISLYYVRTTKSLVRVYRERTMATVIPFPVERTKKKINR